MPMKNPGFIIATLVAGLTGCSVQESDFSKPAGKMYSYRVKVAGGSLEENEKSGDWLKPDIRKDYFQLEEPEKIKFLLFLLAWNKPEAIDGETSFLLTGLFGGKSEKWGDYDKETARMRYRKIVEFGEARRAEFAVALGLPVKGMEENLRRVPKRLELE